MSSVMRPTQHTTKVRSLPLGLNDAVSLSPTIVPPALAALAIGAHTLKRAVTVWAAVWSAQSVLTFRVVRTGHSIDCIS